MFTSVSHKNSSMINLKFYLNFNDQFWNKMLEVEIFTSCLIFSRLRKCSLWLGKIAKYQLNQINFMLEFNLHLNMKTTTTNLIKICVKTQLQLLISRLPAKCNKIYTDIIGERPSPCEWVIHKPGHLFDLDKGMEASKWSIHAWKREDVRQILLKRTYRDRSTLKN